VKLTDQDVYVVARRGEWKIDLYLGQNTGNSSIYVGDGIDDLDRVAGLIASGTNAGAKLMIDVGAYAQLNPGPDFAAQWRFFDLEDLTRIRTMYISLWGPVNRPDEYQPKPAVSMPV